MTPECESNSRRALLTTGSVGKPLTYKTKQNRRKQNKTKTNATRKIVNFPLGIHCNLVMLSFKNVKQQEYGTGTAFLFLYGLRVSDV